MNVAAALTSKSERTAYMLLHIASAAHTAVVVVILQNIQP